MFTILPQMFTILPQLCTILPHSFVPFYHHFEPFYHNVHHLYHPFSLRLSLSPITISVLPCYHHYQTTHLIDHSVPVSVLVHGTILVVIDL